MGCPAHAPQLPAVPEKSLTTLHTQQRAWEPDSQRRRAVRQEARVVGELSVLIGSGSNGEAPHSGPEAAVIQGKFHHHVLLLV